MDDALDRAMGAVADRIGALLRQARSARAASGTNCRAIGSAGSVGIDQRGHGRRDRDRIARGDALQRRQRRSAATRPASAQISDGASRCEALSSRLRSGLRHRRPEHLLDPRCAGRQHHQPVEAERDAARLAA